MKPVALFRSRSNKRRFAKAQAEAKAKGHMVCATVKPNGQPVYFTVPPQAGDADVQDLAFRVRNGRGLAPAEKTLIGLAANRLRKQEA